MKRVGIVAGELSGDVLGADLMRALKARYPGVRFEGVGGPAMLAEDLKGLYPLEALSVMGLVEVLRHLPRLLRVRRRLQRYFADYPPDVFVGIDAPDFNLGLERRLRQSGIRTAHYVSPSVWAWRQGRVAGIARSVDLMLTLFPFEKRFYERHAVPVEFVGHPTADRFALDCDPSVYRRRLSLAPAVAVVAVLPGSRLGEVERLGALFAQAARRIRERSPDVELIAPMATGAIRQRFALALQKAGVEDCRLVDGDSEACMGAADVVLTASGTATLEAMLLKRPMVVGYRVAAASAWLVRRLKLIKTPYFAMPNLLARERIVAEYIQDEARPEALADAVLELLAQPARAAAMRSRFRALHEQLRRGASDRAAEALGRLVTSDGP